MSICWVEPVSRVLVLVAAVVAGSATALSAQPRQPESTAAETMASPAERKMAVAQKKIERDPKHHHGYNELALALTQRARETADPRLLPAGRGGRADVAVALARQLRSAEGAYVGAARPAPLRRGPRRWRPRSTTRCPTT